MISGSVEEGAEDADGFEGILGGFGAEDGVDEEELPVDVGGEGGHF